MSTVQNDSTLKLIEVYNESSKLQKIIFIDVIKDLLGSVYKLFSTNQMAVRMTIQA